MSEKKKIHQDNDNNKNLKDEIKIKMVMRNVE